jgi:ornithine cyclodeaminase/alanine dehydrogenase-like protein (mu-crystallin family)
LVWDFTLSEQDNFLFNDVLRITNEPYVHITDKQVHQHLTDRPSEYLEFAMRRLTAIANGDAELNLPAKQLFVDPRQHGDFRVMPCVVHDDQAVVKTLKLVGTNTEQQLIPQQITVGKAFAIHPLENFVTHIFDACLLSSARTGLCAAIAVRTLAPAKQDITIIGAGRVGYYAAVYCAVQQGIKRFSFSDEDMPRAEHTAAALNRQFPEIQARALPRAQLMDTDVLILATYSKQALYGPDDFRAKLIISLGADTDDQHELDEAWARADLYVDTMDSARYGDLHAWQAAGLINKEQLTDLFQILQHPPSADTDQARVFVSTGSALFDNLTIHYLLQRLAEDN